MGATGILACPLMVTTPCGVHFPGNICSSTWGKKADLPEINFGISSTAFTL